MCSEMQRIEQDKAAKNGLISELETAASQPDENGTQKTASITSENMRKLNAVNWPYFVQDSESRFNEPLNCLDCLRVFLRRK